MTNAEASGHPRHIPDPTIELAGAVVTNRLEAADPKKRADLVEDLQAVLEEARIIVVDTTAADATERRGMRTNLTRQELIDARALRRNWANTGRHRRGGHAV